jgi:PIN domain nuclease of toxin-antitoxin system
VKLLADTQAIYWYLVRPAKLSDKALRVLSQAEADGTIIVSALTIPELWMATTRKSGRRAIPQEGYLAVQAALLNPASMIAIEPVTPGTVGTLRGRVHAANDPFDALIVATAISLGIPVVTADQAITNADVDVIW